MKHLSKCLALVLAAALVLGLAACGKDTTGDDWRASGVVTDYGTITRDGVSLACLAPTRFIGEMGAARPTTVGSQRFLRDAGLN